MHHRRRWLVICAVGFALLVLAVVLLKEPNLARRPVRSDEGKPGDAVIAVAAFPPSANAGDLIASKAVAGSQSAITKALPASLHDVSVQVVTKAGEPVVDVAVRLSQRWLLADEMHTAACPMRQTDTNGIAWFRVPPGNWFVHAWHEFMAPSTSERHGSGDQLVIQVPGESSARIELLPIYIVCYEVVADSPPVSHGSYGGGFRSLLSEMDPMFASRQRRVQAEIQQKFPRAVVSMYLFTGDPKHLGQWEVRAVWSGRTPVVVPLHPTDLRDFKSPQIVSPAGSIPASDFGSVMLLTDQTTLTALQGITVSAKPLAHHRTLRTMTCPLALDGISALPTGTYELIVDGHPFLSTAAKQLGSFEVHQGDLVTRHLTLKRFRRVHLSFQLPAGFQHRPYFGALMQASGGPRVSLMAHLESEAKDWLLPVGDYAYEIHMATGNVQHSELFGRGRFTVADDATDKQLIVPVELSERDSQSSTGR